MPTYPKSAYKNLFGGSPSSAKSRGWGNGWPNCQTSKLKTITAQDQTKGQDYDIRVTVREEVAEMVRDLLEATDRVYDIKKSSTGAYNCRPIGGTRTASNHSWGLAIDINWGDNPQSSTFKSTIPPKVVEMWQKAGWYWGGFYTRAKPDTMHFEYTGKPSDVAKHAKIAASYNNSKPETPKPPVTPPKPTVPPQPSLNLKWDDSLVPWDRSHLVPSVKRALNILGFFRKPDNPQAGYSEAYDAFLVEGVADWHRSSGGRKYSSGGYDGHLGPRGYAALMAQARAVKG